MSDPLTIRLGDELRSGIQTDGQIETEPRGFAVTWIEWDSDFRRQLRINDLIVGVNGRSLAPFLQPGKMGKGVGQHGEPSYWTDIGARHDDVIALSVLRDGEPLTVEGRLHLNYFYYDAQGRPALAAGGPARLASDGFDGPWSMWLEDVTKRLSLHFSAGWTQRSYNSRNELAWYMEQKPRVDYLLAKHPGAFAERMREDWTRGMELARGKLAELGPEALEYRRLGARRIELAKAAAATAWQAALQQHAPRMMPAFPAPDVMAREASVGAIVELPAITFRNFLNDLGRSFIAIGSASDGFYFVLLDDPAFRELYGAIARYRGQVNPRLDERYRFLARVRDDPQMFTVGGRSVMGLTVTPVGALAGQDEVFVDLGSSPPRFAGEDALSSVPEFARDDRSPASVITAMIQALKSGDDETWTSLFAPWRVLSGSGGRTIIDPSYSADRSRFMSDWERSRRLIMGEVYDARVERVERVRRVLEHSAGNGLPNVDEVVVWVDHYGLFDGEYRTFQNTTVHRQWVLQRLDEGPWRITSIQGL